MVVSRFCNYIPDIISYSTEFSVRKLAVATVAERGLKMEIW